MDPNFKYFALAPTLDLSVVIGVYNEGENVDELLPRLNGVLSGSGLDYEIVIVDDGSSDDTLARLRNHLTTVRGLRIVELYRNVGQVGAISAGMSVARGGWILMMDGDLQHDPSDIPRFLALREKEWDLIGSYRKKRNENVRRKIVTALVNRINRALLGIEIRDFGSSYRLIRTEIVAMIKDRQGYVHYNTPDLFFNSKRIVEIPITQGKRYSGSSKWDFVSFVKFNFDFLLSSTHPIILATNCSIIGMAVGISLYLLYLVGAITVVQALTGPISIVFTSLIMFMLSVIWYEVARARKLSMGNPLFLIRAIHDMNPQTLSLTTPNYEINVTNA
jgi:glycosyltransferase involved in cell wall biosynthesis